MSTSIAGASVWEQDLYGHLVDHVDSEQAVIHQYRDAAQKSPSRAFAYLARLILEDEQRHHRMMQDLAESLRQYAESLGKEETIPLLDRPSDRDELIALTDELLAVEKTDQRELAQLRKDIDAAGVRTLWPLIIRLIEHDTSKHIEILTFARRWLRGR